MDYCHECGDGTDNKCDHMDCHEGVVRNVDGVPMVEYETSEGTEYIELCDRHKKESWFVMNRQVGFKVLFECHNYGGEHVGKDCSCRGGDIREMAFLKWVRAHRPLI